jgi:hypothetical protein
MSNPVFFESVHNWVGTNLKDQYDPIEEAIANKTEPHHNRDNVECGSQVEHGRRIKVGAQQRAWYS